MEEDVEGWKVGRTQFSTLPFFQFLEPALIVYLTPVEWLVEILLCALYAGLGIWVIYKSRFFESDGLSKKVISGIFILKIFFGFALWYIYTFYYTDRSKADIYKYFDASKYMFDALFIKPLDYFQMVTGLEFDEDYFESHYHKYMMNWSQRYQTDFVLEARTLIRFNAICRLFSFGFYNVHGIFMSMISLIGLVAIYKSFLPFFEKKKKELILAVFLIPSILFWSSGVLKEGLLFFEIGLIIYNLQLILQSGFTWKSACWIVFCMFLMVLTKLYILAALLSCFAAMVWVAKTSYKNPVLKYAIVFLLLLAVGTNIQVVLPKIDLLRILSKKQESFINASKGGALIYRNIDGKKDTIYIAPQHLDCIEILWQENYEKFTSYVRLKQGCSYQLMVNRKHSEMGVVAQGDTTIHTMDVNAGNPGSVITIPELQPNLISFLRNTPSAIVNTFFRPFLWEANSVLMFISALETLMVLLLGVICIYFRKKMTPQEMNMFCFSLLFVLFIYVLAGLTAPVLGAIARYKVPVLPFLLIAIFLLLDKERLLQKFPFLNFLKEK